MAKKIHLRYDSVIQTESNRRVLLKRPDDGVRKRPAFLAVLLSLKQPGDAKQRAIFKLMDPGAGIFGN